jgi:hypothetical protein
LNAWFSSRTKNTWSAAGIAVGVGDGVGLGVGLDAGFGVGVADAVEPEALTAPPPQPVASKSRDRNSTQHTIFEAMGNDLLHTTALDAAELLDVGLMLYCS